MMESKTDGRSTGYFSPACGLKFLETTEGAGMYVCDGSYRVQWIRASLSGHGERDNEYGYHTPL